MSVIYTCTYVVSMHVHAVCCNVACNALADPTIWSHLQSRFESSDFRDVLDGKEHEFLSEPGNVSLLLNTDGVSMFKSSNISIWPIWLVINELPPHIR